MDTPPPAVTTPQSLRNPSTVSLGGWTSVAGGDIIVPWSKRRGDNAALTEASSLGSAGRSK
jgi:hypothetical protein